MRFAVGWVALAAAVMVAGARGALPANLVAQAGQIMDFMVNGTGRGQTYDKLAEFVDTIGSRLCGSESLTAAEDYMLRALALDGLDNVHGGQ